MGGEESEADMGMDMDEGGERGEKAWACRVDWRDRLFGG